MRAAALLSLWNGVAPGRRAEYERWHQLEHVPERVWVPGFVAGTRYRADGPAPAEYFTLYELRDLACLDSAAYRALVDAPTPWSASMRPALRDFVRKPGPVVAREGAGVGAALAVGRLVWAPGAAPDADGWAAFCRRLLAADGVCRVRVQRVAEAGPQALRNADAAPPGDEYVCLADLFDPAALPTLPAWPGAAPLWCVQGRYRLVSQVVHAEVAAPRRPPPRDDLRPAARRDSA
ncbi:hypothetical protein [Pseudorhodoferax sp.]|uniref:hypothetical protein n=1 Tax=Pseudorhodoferax sp. TaxID=1993553 RepID=UPI0039E50771